MPIKIQTGSFEEVCREIGKFEEDYEISSAEFAALPSIEGVVSEFDAIEWNFLLMQRSAHEESRCGASPLFRASFETQVSKVESDELYACAA